MFTEADYDKFCRIQRQYSIMKSMKREDQQDATIKCLLLTSVSTCFGHHYAHLQEIKGPVTAFGVLFWFCWKWLVAVDGRCLPKAKKYSSIKQCSLSFASHGEVPCSIPGQFIGILGSQTNTWTGLFRVLQFPLPLSFHRCSLFIKSSISDAKN